MDRLINENAVLSAIGEWIAHNEHTYTNATEYLRNRVKAIKTAKQEPCEDCISREEVCDYIAEFVNHEYATDREREMVKNIISGIQHLPSIQPTTKENLVVEDCISRKVVLDLVEDMTDQFGVEHRVITEGVISMLPPVTPKPKTEWIPVSERLPKEGETVLVCYQTQGGVAQSVCEWFEMHNGGIVWSTLCGEKPIAWMPLPEPYMAEKE